MINYNDIINAFTKELSLNYSEIDIFNSKLKQGFESSCFFVQLISLTNTESTLETNNKVFTVDIQYISEDELTSIYSKLSELENIFARYITVKDRVLKFREIENEIIEDEVGYILHFMITIDFEEEIMVEKEEYELVKEINLILEQED